MNFLQKILVVLFILISGSLKASEVTDLYENEEFDAAYRLGYAKALNGDTESLFIIGKILIGGDGSSEENVKKGLKFIKSAAEDDYQKAIIFLAINYEEGEFSKKNNKLALKYYEKCAENGSSKCKKKRDKLYIKLTGEISKKTCKTYNKKDKKLANKIARCIVSGHLEGNASSYYLISFDKGNINDFLKAADRMLKPESGANLMILAKKLPNFYEKASKNQVKKLSKISKKYGYDFKSCNIKKSKLGFKSKGNPLSCVFAAIAGDTKASPIVSKWWRDGDKGLPKSKKIALLMMENAESGDDVDFASILKSLENDPRAHFKKAKSFLSSSPLSKTIIGKELKLEAKLLAAGKPTEFASKEEDIGVVLSNIDWNVLKPKTISDLIYLFKTDYKEDEVMSEVISSSKVVRNMNKIPFSEDVYINLIKQDDSQYARQFLETKIYNDCNALKFATNKNEFEIEIIQKAQKKLAGKCMKVVSPSKKGKKSMQALMMQAEVDFDKNKVLIEVRLNRKNSCSDYQIYLTEEWRLGENHQYLDVDFDRLGKICANDSTVIYKKAEIAFNNQDYDEAHELSEKACDSKQAIGCEIIATIIKDRLSANARAYAPEEIKSVVINFLMQGHEAGDDKSTAMLFDLYNQNPIFSSYSSTSQAEEMIKILRKKNSLAAKVRKKNRLFFK